MKILDEDFLGSLIAAAHGDSYFDPQERKKQKQKLNLKDNIIQFPNRKLNSPKPATDPE